MRFSLPVYYNNHKTSAVLTIRLKDSPQPDGQGYDLTGGTMMNRAALRCRIGKVFFFALFCALISFGAAIPGPLTAYATNLYGSEVKTSQLTAGTDYDIVQDMVLTIDKSIRIGKLYTGLHSLTIQGSSDAMLTMSELKTASGGTAKDIVLTSGSVEIDNINGPNHSRSALYSTGHLRIDGGSLTVYASRSAPMTPFVFGIEVNSYEMNGGTVRIDVRSSEEASVDGLYISGDRSSVISGGTIDITSLKTGIGLGHGSLTISGGHVSAEGGLGTSEGYGITGSSGTKIRISGGQVFAKGGSHGIYFPVTEICGTARVDAEGQQTCGISGGSFSILDNAYLKAWGRNYAILAEHNHGGIVIGPQHYFVKPVSAAISTPADRQETNTREFIAESVRTLWAPATEVVIDHTGISEADPASSAGPAGSADPGEIKKSIVPSLPVNTELKAPDAAGFYADGTLSKKRMTVHFEKVEGASDYVIAWKKATAKKWNYARCGNKDTYVIRGLKRGTLVQLKIASYAYGRRGPWSKTARFCFESVKASVSRKGKKLTVTFNQVKGATGYQLLLADNPDMSGFKTRSVRNTRKLVLKNLKKTRKYYICWRLYKTYKGKKYYGLCSKIRKI